MDAYIATIAYFFISIIIIIIGVIIFELLTKKYKDMEEVHHGNTAVALSIAGKIIGISIILAFAIYHSNYIYETVIWGIFGVVLQMVAYMLVNLVIRRFSVEEELKKNNIAVGIISFSVSIGIAFVVGASIT